MKVIYNCTLNGKSLVDAFINWKPSHKVCISTQCITMGQKYKFTYHPKKLGSAGDHGIVFGYDTSRFQSLSQTVINFSDLIDKKDHNQNAVCTRLLDLYVDVKAEVKTPLNDVILVCVVHLKAKKDY